MLALMADVPLAALDDEALAERARAGDDAAFAALVERYQERVYRLALRLSSNPSDAEEVLQEAFLQAWRKIDTFRGDARFGTWLYRIATNTALMHKRAARRRPTESLEALLPQFDESGLLADLDYQRSARADELLERASWRSARARPSICSTRTTAPCSSCATWKRCPRRRWRGSSRSRPRRSASACTARV